MRAVSLKEMGVPLADRLREFPWMLSDLIFPFMGEYLVSLSRKLCGLSLRGGTTLTIVPAHLVPHLGDDPKHPRRVDALRR